MKALVVHNPKAGRGGHSAAWISAALELAGHDVRYCSFKSEEFPACMGRNEDLVIAAGGDGTVSDIVENMPDRSVPVAILPIGGSNDIACTFGICGRISQIVRGWNPDRTSPLHVGRVQMHGNSAPFTESVGLGAIPQSLFDLKRVHHRPDKKLRKGRKAVAAAVMTTEPNPVALTLDGETRLLEDVVALEVMNIAFAGPRLRLVASGLHRPGHFAVVALRESWRMAFCLWMEQGQIGPAPVEILYARHVALDWEALPIRIDDTVEAVGRSAHRVEIGLEPDPARIVQPVHPGDANLEGALLT